MVAVTTPSETVAPVPGTLRHSFEHQLAELQDDILRMGSFVVEMLGVAVQALVRQETELAEHVIQMDDTADQMELQIEHTCMRLLALQQPMSRDLRIIGTALKVITDLERIGDFAVDIAKTARRLAGEPYFKPLNDLSRMASATEWMVRECIHAYVEHDLDLVYQVVARDDEVDDCYDRLFTELLRRMEKDPTVIRQAAWLLHVARFLERIGDHAVNVAERVYYVETGELRQLGKRRDSPNGTPPFGLAGG
jgi:phosphate transport system protein